MPTVKNLQEKFRVVMQDLKAASIANQHASGVPEELSQTNLLLNNLLLEQKD